MTAAHARHTARRWVWVLAALLGLAGLAGFTGCQLVGRAAPVRTPPSGMARGGVGPADASAVPGTPSAAPTAQRYLFPVAAHAEYARTHHDYPATDVFADCGSGVRSPTAGVVLEVSRVDTFDPANPRGEDKGGLSVSIRGDDGVRYYGSHLSVIANGIDAGTRVAAGTPLGKVGETGNSSHICHLHFGISPPCLGTGDWWTRRGVVYPWRYLDAWRAEQSLSPAPEVAAWQRAHGCPSTPPPGTV